MGIFLKKTNNVGLGALGKVGGKIWDNLMDYFSDTDITSSLDVSAGGMAKINTPTAFRDDRLKIFDSSGNSFLYSFSTGSLTANRQITIPALTGDVTMAFQETNRSIDADYFIHKSGSTYYAIKATDNSVFNSGSSFRTVLLAVVAALPSGGTIELGSGDFNLTSQVSLSQSKIWIRGQGAATRIVFDATMTSTGAGFIYGGSLGGAVALTANAARGAHALTVGSGHGMAANDWIYLKCTRAVQSAGNNGTDAEIHQLYSTASTTLTLKDYLYDVYNTSTTSTAYKITWASDIKISDLVFYDARTLVSAITEQADVLFLFCYNLQLDHVKFEHMYYCSVALQNCYNAEVDECAYETPQFLDGSTFWVNYGIDILSASTNITLNGGWANRCRHSVTTDCIAGQTYGGGRQRNITVNGMKSYNANTSHFDSHEGVVGLTFNGCVAIGGYHQFAAEYAAGQTGQTPQTDQVKGFTARSPTTFNGCIAQDCENYAFALFNDADTAGTDALPGSNGSIISHCQIRSTQTGGSGSVGVTRGIRVLDNRADVQIIGNYFFNILEEPILIATGTKNIIIKDNIFHTCGASLSSSRGLIRCVGTITDLIVQGNIFGAGTAPASARPLEVATSVASLIFKDNDCNGLTNKSPVLTAASTDVTMMDNLGLNPIGNVSTPINTSNNTIGSYGGTTATAVASTDYTVVGGTMIMFVTGGTAVSASVKSGAGTTMESGLTTPFTRTLPKGYKINFGGFTGTAPTILVGAY